MSSNVKAGASYCGLEAVEDRLSSDAFLKLFSLTNKDFGLGRGLNPVGDGRGARRLPEVDRPPERISVS